ncbi:IZH3 [Candida margitis]|uniref:IZH3 n=1 Tax=Candida margitis TaxID=1775924 RepID=UPI00222659DC|nr:IZH3 [Candida margitis]KAI5961077.1 IZH3 [Candida margitis]
MSTSTATELFSQGTDPTNRFARNSSSSNENINKHNSSTVEELLIEKLDYFVSSIEARLNNFEIFFKWKEAHANDESVVAERANGYSNSSSNNFYKSGGSLSPRDRSDSSSSLQSLQSLKEVSLNKLNLVRDRLRLIKKSVLSKGFTNVEFLYNLLTDQYDYLFNSVVDPDMLDGEQQHGQEEKLIDEATTETTGAATAGVSPREVLSNKLIDMIYYFDQKLTNIDDYLREKNAIVDSGFIDLQNNEQQQQSPHFVNLRYFNFNRALKNAAKNKYVHYYELPLMWRENKYIIQGYRFSLKHSEMWKSVFAWHNETMNIWSHLVGVGIVCIIGLVQFPSSDVFPLMNKWDKLAMYGFLLSALGCLVSSSTWHTYSCFAHYPSRANFACIDYSGITLLITCSVTAIEYCALYNHPTLSLAFMIFTMMCGIGGFAFNWSPYFDKPECRPLRIGFFIGLSFSGSTALLCQSWYYGVWRAFWFTLPLFYKSFVWYLLGVVFYGGLIPERWRFDVIIEENNANACHHHYDAIDVIEDNVGHAGEEEIDQIEQELLDLELRRKQRVNDALNGETEKDIKKHAEDEGAVTEHDSVTDMDEEEDDDDDFKRLVKKHFKNEPTKTPYADKFMSLWWVDYFLASHNIWHICVLLGILGHYSCLVHMFNEIKGVS